MKLKITFFFFILLYSGSFKAQEFNDPTQQIKIGFSSLFRGDFMLGYERMINKKWSVEFDVGMLTRDYSENFFYEISNSIEQVSLPGISIAPSVRYYPYIPLTEFFITAELKQRTYRFITNDAVIGKTTHVESRTSPRLGLGYMYFFDEHLKLDVSSNVGFTFVKATLDSDPDTNGPTPNKFHFGLNIKFSYSI